MLISKFYIVDFELSVTKPPNQSIHTLIEQGLFWGAYCAYFRTYRPRYAPKQFKQDW